ncbi:hypothetical protein M409DRAFT_28469 [Zasmidium cellare ATCC 36951]|uniref:SnoaL-like domain-containing protein n=1 Tax=Zasmidium cellare ATCC 36951 TaxID=1080233 RepID=A0A6A6C5X4_ZASCE|nr:uncharacterized protein M409DRAFT_28469 [Zasmidium cellare ATCC 36951]KAF2161139.1 hypothetical protein M409DRAFT_28469 [Zasmidium cellare ATCC 36951]
MPLTSIPIPLPLNPFPLPSHPALDFYTLYGQKFPKTPEQWKTTNWEDFYSKDYGPFPTITREMLSLNIVSDSEKGTHEIHAEFLTKLPSSKGVVELPQAFVYTLGEADEGKGTSGWQIRELRCYYDLRTWEGAGGK